MRSMQSLRMLEPLLEILVDRISVKVKDREDMIDEDEAVVRK